MQGSSSAHAVPVVTIKIAPIPSNSVVGSKEMVGMADAVGAVDGFCVKNPGGTMTVHDTALGTPCTAPAS